MNILQTIIFLIQIILILRFHLEISKINGFLEPVNTIRKYTNPIVLPIKRIIPNPLIKKLSAVIVAYIITFIITFVVLNLSTTRAILFSFTSVIGTWLKFLQYGIFLFVIGSWIQIPAMQRINYILFNIFSPILKPIQRILPSFGGLDFSPIILLFALSFLSNTFSKIMFNIIVRYTN